LIFAYFTGYFWQKCVSFGKAAGYVKNKVDSCNRAVQADLLRTKTRLIFKTASISFRLMKILTIHADFIDDLFVDDVV